MDTTDKYTSEDDVKYKFIIPYLEKKGYSKELMEFNKSIKVQEGRKKKTIFADVVVYIDKKRQSPVILIETKSPKEILNKSAVEQAISYARLLPRIAPFVILTNSLQIRTYQVVTKNRIDEVPNKKDLAKDIVDLVISKSIQNALRQDAIHELFIIDDVKTFRNVLKQCHNEIRNNEGYDPTQAFDEMSKILFCKMYEEKYNYSNNRFRLNIYDKTMDGLGVNIIQKIYEETVKHPKYESLFAKDDKIKLKDHTIRKIVKLFENYDLSLTNFDVKGEAFEYFLSDTFTGGLGEYFTPRNVVEFMVETVNPKIGEKIVDPFCGTGGFLIYAFDVISEKIGLQDFSEEEKDRWQEELSNKSLFGTDWKERTIQACKMNMIVHGDGHTGIFLDHGLKDVKKYIEKEKFNICITNPPFGSIENESGVLKKYELGMNRKTQERVILAIERAVKLVKPKGLVAIVVIDGILNTRTKKYVRDYIKKNAWIRGIISLADETFQGYGSRANTSIVLLQKKEKVDDGKQNPVFMAIAKNTGYAPNGSQIPGNELPDILLNYISFIQDGKLMKEFPHIKICNVEDRLDAEYYCKSKSRRDIRDMTKIRREISKLIESTVFEYSQLQDNLQKFFKIKKFKLIHLGDILQEVKKKETLDSNKKYNLLGVRWWGKGTFIRENKLAKDIKAKTLNLVSHGQIIYNRLFAYRGSFALVKKEHDNCYVSNEFPTFVVKGNVKNKKAMSKYIVHCLNSPKYLEIVESLSTGSTKTSRNRFNQTQFLNLTIKVPSKKEDMDDIISILERIDVLRNNQGVLSEQVKNLRDEITSLIPFPN